MGRLQPESDLDLEAVMQLKALGINQILGSDEGMADNYGQINRRAGQVTALADNLANLGNIYWTLGKPGHAESMYRKAIALFKQTACAEKADKAAGLLNGLIAAHNL